MNNNFVYILSNISNSVIYVGVTSDLEKRIYQHKNKQISGFTKKYNLNKLVYFEQFDGIQNAIKREKQIKNWRRDKKDFLINQINPNWNDISEPWYRDPSTSLGMTKKISTLNVVPRASDESKEVSK
ncbi:MAG: GIY-YIG nuclease family protein [Pseudomonadota bacterium]